METATLPSGPSIDELLDWRPRFGLLTVGVEIDPADRGEGWLIALRNALDAAVGAGPCGQRRSACSTASRMRSCPRAAARSASARSPASVGPATSGPPPRWRGSEPAPAT